MGTKMSMPSNENVAQNAQRIEAREQDKKQFRQEKAQALMELARARKAFLMVLVSHLEQSDNPHAQRAAAELRCEWSWHVFEEWYAQRGARRLLRRRIFALLRMIEGQSDG
jgi:hypothetical protein